MANDGLGSEQASTKRAEAHDLMTAMIGACAFIAHADGSVDAKERNRVLLMMRTLPLFASFSSEAVLGEFIRHEQAFKDAPDRARTAVLEVISALPQHHDDVRLLLGACQTVLEADGVYHPNEYSALGEIGRALGPPSSA